MLLAAKLRLKAAIFKIYLISKLSGTTTILTKFLKS